MANNILFCSQCGAQITTGAAFCQKCGSRLEAPAAIAPAPATTGSYPAAAASAYPAVPVLAENCYGGFWIRVAAYVIDYLLIAAVTAPLYLLFILPGILRIMREAQAGIQPRPESLAPFIATAILLGCAIFVGQWLYDALLNSSSWQGTVGKHLLHLKVTDDFGNRISFARASGRFFARILSFAAMYVGVIMVAFMERKRGLHDVICSTQVLRY